ncbi:phosphotransferase [Paenibacillus sp. MBLB4367]|uniref:phosphotransferase n=1 Tax=Paenibacillus sp. MBLB4367 TaxID=3384767 RepID=UPI0039080D84
MDVATVVSLIESNYMLNKVRIVESPQGASNITRYVRAENQQYVLRIYSQKQIEKVIGEHAVISKLRERKFVYETPDFLTTKTGKTYVQSNGLLLALYPYIPGEPFKREQIHEFGKALGYSLSFFKSIPPEELTQSNDNLYKAFLQSKIVDQNTLYNRLIQTPFHFSKEDAKVLTDEMERQSGLVVRYSQLPHQLIHGDLIRLNVLFHPTKQDVTGILDFELAAVSIKALEIATSLTSLLRMNDLDDEDMFSRVDEFISGFKQYEIINPTEIELLPQLIMLRLASVSLFHINRFAADQKSDFIVRYYSFYLAWQKWLTVNGDRLQHICKK